MLEKHPHYLLSAGNKKWLLKKLERSNTIILKLGTNILNSPLETGSADYFNRLAKSVVSIKKSGKRVLIVSSGAVGMGKSQLGGKENLQISEKQALASVGQSLLIEKYRVAFLKHKVNVGQILVSKSDLSNRTSYRNLMNTLNQLLEWDVVPIINENDAVNIEELRFGDNDTLASSMASFFSDSVLLILTTVNGYQIEGKLAEHIPAISHEVKRHAGLALPGGTGGMITKLKSAQHLLRSALLMGIFAGKDPGDLKKILSASIPGTWFFNNESEKVMPAKKRWILQNKHLAAKLTIDAGAAQALLEKNASLLAVGIQKVSGSFSHGEIVQVLDEAGNSIAKGQVQVNSKDIESNQKKVVIHKDVLVLIKDDEN